MKNGGQILVDASNLVGGGGVQVAASLVDEMVAMKDDREASENWPLLECIRFEVSAAVAASMVTEPAPEGFSVVSNRPPLMRRVAPMGARGQEFEACLTVFGANYGPRRGKREIVGCADVTSFYPSELMHEPTTAKARRRLRATAARRWFARADVLIVETHEMQRRVREVLGSRAPRIEVVSNTYNAIFDHPTKWHDGPLVPDHGRPIKLAFITRAYPHKNLGFLVALHPCLEKLLRRQVKFVLSLTDLELASIPGLARCSINLGPLRLPDVPSVYEKCDALIFPSLLEAFSVSPVEAMKMRLPVFASDRPFVREICGDAAVYFDPYAPAVAAEAISEALLDRARLEVMRHLGLGMVQRLPTPRRRAETVLDILTESLTTASRSRAP